jgi:hypothetical protein
MSLTSSQQNKYNKQIVEWMVKNYSGKEFSVEDVLVALSSESSVKFPKLKKVKDSNKPKKANTAWICFTQEMREKVKADNPEASTTDLTKIMSPMWKALSDSERQKYEDMASKDKERYEKEMVDYKPSDSDSDSDADKPPKVSKAKPKKNKDPSAPKKMTLRAYVMKEFKQKINDMCVDNAVDGKNANFMKMVSVFIEGCSEDELSEIQEKLDEHNNSL